MKNTSNDSSDLGSLLMPDFDAIDVSEGIPFATGTDGEPVVLRTGDVFPHVLVAGKVGAGKSIFARAVLYGALVRGWRCYVVDSMKGGADFAFAKDRCAAFATGIFQAAGLMKEIYGEVVRRKDLNAEHDVGSYKDLPEDARPPHILVFVDEFPSLVAQFPLPPKTDDPAMDNIRAEIKAENFARAEVGAFAGKLAREARSSGVTLVLAVEKLNGRMLADVPGASDIKAGMARMLLGRASVGGRAAVLRSPYGAPFLKEGSAAGCGLWESGESAAEMMQVWYAETDVYREMLVDRVPELPEDGRVDVSRFVAPVGVG